MRIEFGEDRDPAELKVMLITGHAENTAVGNDHLEPGMKVIIKPFALDALAVRIREKLSE